MEIRKTNEFGTESTLVTLNTEDQVKVASRVKKVIAKTINSFDGRQFGAYKRSSDRTKWVKLFRTNEKEIYETVRKAIGVDNNNVIVGFDGTGYKIDVEAYTRMMVHINLNTYSSQFIELENIF